jgi:hypothetical protein
MTAIDDNGCIEFGPKSKACPSWPVRVQGMQGLWRYLGPLAQAIDMNRGAIVTHVEVIGPYFPNNPARNGGRSRIVSLDQIKYAGKNAKPIDVISVETQAISSEAQRARRR